MRYENFEAVRKQYYTNFDDFEERQRYYANVLGERSAIVRKLEYPPKLEQRWIKYNNSNADSCILVLPGRSNHAMEIACVYRDMGVKSLIIGITPTIRSWYPMPNGIYDQDAAVEGIKPAVGVIEEVVQIIETKKGIPRNRIILVGHSAGAVMAIMTAVYSPQPFGAVISHCGAILNVNDVPECQCPETAFLLTHSRDDLIFDWHERFVPMFQTLQEKNYKVYTAIAKDASHCITERQFELGKYLIEMTLNNK
jgi:predicted esterase